MNNPLLPSLAPAAMGAFRYSFLALYGINSVMCNYIRRHCIGITRTILYCALGQQNDCTFCPLVALRAYVYYLASKCTSTAHFFSLSPFPLKGLPTPILSPIFPSPPPGGATHRLQINLEYPHSLQIFQVVNLAHYPYSLQYLHYPHSLQPLTLLIVYCTSEEMKQIPYFVYHFLHVST